MFWKWSKKLMWLEKEASLPVKVGIGTYDIIVVFKLRVMSKPVPTK